MSKKILGTRKNVNITELSKQNQKLSYPGALSIYTLYKGWKNKKKTFQDSK